MLFLLGYNLKLLLSGAGELAFDGGKRGLNIRSGESTGGQRWAGGTSKFLTVGGWDSEMRWMH